MKRWRCTVCGEEILAFEEDVINGRDTCFAIVKERSHLDHKCVFEPIETWQNSTIHGEAGWMTEGTMLDSMSTIHDGESQNIQEAEGFRELKQLNDGMKCM